MQLSVHIEINKPKTDVWAAITDIKNSANMIDAILDIEVLHDPDDSFIGFKWKEKRQMFGKDAFETMWITHWVENEYYSTRAESHGSIYATNLSLNETPQGCTLTMEFQAQGQTLLMKLLTKPMGWMMNPSMIKMLQVDLDNIKTFVENK